MAGEEENGEPLELPLVYVGAEDEPILLANHFHIYHHEGQFVLAVGQLQRPMLLGSEEEMREQVRQLSYVPIRILGQFAMDSQVLGRLIAALQDNLRKYEERTGGG